MTDLSIIIPSRNEPFLLNTINDILANKEADTEIICILDGNWSIEPIPDDPRITLIHHVTPIGQRAAINEGVRISNAKYIMKADAHCAFGPGFDRILIEDMQPDWTMVPIMYNLHVFDWICQKCNHRRYQSPTPKDCPECDNTADFIKDIVWFSKPSPESTAMRFDSDLKFQYWGKYKAQQYGDLVETMSILGACFMMARERYLELQLCDEGHGSWGQMGTEIACATWLSGGKLICNRRTWFAHMFRTQGGDFGFPYPLKSSETSHARRYSQDLWFNNKHPKQVHSLSWLIKKFWPVPDWSDEDLGKIEQKKFKPRLTKGSIFYTDNRLNPDIAQACQQQLYDSLNGHRLVSVSLRPLDFGHNISLDLERGYLTMFRQILAGIEACQTDIVFLCEHDILYHPSHFDFTPARQDVYYYNQNVWKVDYETGEALFYYVNQTSGLCAYRELLLEHYQKRVELVEANGYTRRMGFEPGTHGRKERVDNYGHEAWFSAHPNIDIRHDKNLTPSRWSQDQFRNKRYRRGWTEADEIPGWGKTIELLEGIKDG